MNYQIVHSIRGRLRIRIPRLAWDSEFSTRLCWLIEPLERVTSVRVNPTASSIVITYETAGTECEVVQQNVLTCIWKLYASDRGEAHHDPPAAFEETELEPEVNHWQDLGFPVLSLGVALLAAPLELPAIVAGTAIAGAAMPWFVRAADSLMTHRQPNIDLLDSLWMTLQTLNGQYTAPALKTCLVEVRRALRGTTADQREQQAQAILNEFNQEVWIERDGQHHLIVASAIQPGDRIAVSANETIPVDGWIVEGTALINEQNLTGETISIACSAGQLVYASTRVVEGKIWIVAEHTGLNTRIGIVAQLMQSAPVHDTHLGVQQAEFLRSVVFPTILFGGTMFALTGNFGAAVSPLQFDFGSGIPISVHTTLLYALTYTARHGIYIRSARILELLSQLDAIVLDSDGVFDAAGSLRLNCRMTIAQLQQQGVEIYWIMQDESQAAIAAQLGIPQTHTWLESSPDRASVLISGLQHHGKTVAFVGSNELAAIQADVAVSFSAQPDGSDVILMQDDLRGLIEAIAVAHRAIQVVYENTAIIVMPNLLIQIVGGMMLGIHPVINVITNNSSAFVAEFVHGARPLFDHYTPSPIARYPRKLRRAIKHASAPALQFLKQTELAKRLGVPVQALTPRRSKPEFGQWTQAKDPEGKAWQYDAIAKGFYAI